MSTNIKITKKCTLEISRAGKLKAVYCPVDGDPCGDVCALFKEPTIEEYDTVNGPIRTVELELCRATHYCNEDEFVDERQS
jgi:hypothetical protein